jgi:hypothetical protein
LTFIRAALLEGAFMGVGTAFSARHFTAKLIRRADFNSSAPCARLSILG